MKKSSLFAAVVLTLLSGSCGNKEKGGADGFPSDFAAMGDTGRVAYIMDKATPDSVARFIIYGALGDIPGVRIDSLGTVTNYVYSTYSSDDQITFGEEYDKVVDGLALSRRMRLYALGGAEDPQGLGYELGLSYLTRIREKSLTAYEVDEEIREFRKACGSDSATYRRFVTGFTTVLKVDSGKDVSKEIYDRFIRLDSGI